MTPFLRKIKKKVGERDRTMPTSIIIMPNDNYNKL